MHGTIDTIRPTKLCSNHKIFNTKINTIKTVNRRAYSYQMQEKERGRRGGGRKGGRREKKKNENPHSQACTETMKLLTLVTCTYCTYVRIKHPPCVQHPTSIHANILQRDRKECIKGSSIVKFFSSYNNVFVVAVTLNEKQKVSTSACFLC